MHYYLGHWDWVAATATDEGFWRPPAAARGILDLRTLSQQVVSGGPPGHGLFAYADVQAGEPLLDVDLGSDLEVLLSAARTAALRSHLAVQLARADLRDTLWQLLLDPANYDATGQTHWKPLRGSARRGVQLTLAGQLLRAGPVQEAFDATVAVFRADYMADRDMRPLNVLRRWTGATMRSLGLPLDTQSAEAILPPAVRGDGWLTPETSLTDTFTDTVGVNLTAHVPTPTNWGSWVKAFGAGDLLIVSNGIQKELGDTSRPDYRANVDLSSDDHSVEATTEALDAGSGTSDNNWDTEARYASAAQTFYGTRIENSVTNGVRTDLHKRVAGTRTVLSGPTADTFTAAAILRVTADSSTITGRYDGVDVHSVTDTSITGNLRSGVGSQRRSTAQSVIVDNFFAQDIVAAVASIPKPQLIMRPAPFAPGSARR